MGFYRRAIDGIGRFLAPELPPERAWKRDLSVIASAWFLVRLPLVVWMAPPLVQCDSFWFQSFAGTLRDPHSPFLYGQFRNFFGPFWTAPVQHALVLFCAWMLYWLGKSLAGRASGLCAGLCAALYGGFVLYAQSLMNEILFIFFLVSHVSLLALGLFRERDNGRTFLPWLFLSGVAAGLGSNVRAVLQYQPVILAMTILPFYLGRPRILRYFKLASAIALGFSLVVVPVELATWRVFGKFTLSTGLPKAAMYRLVWDEAAPLSAVDTGGDPVLTAIRDYLAGVGKDDNVIWGSAYVHIRENILGLHSGDNARDNQAVDRMVMRLWRRCVATYPDRYTAYSLSILAATMSSSDLFENQWNNSIAVLNDNNLTGPFVAIRYLKRPGANAIRYIGSFYTALTAPFLILPLTVVVLLRGAFLGMGPPGPRRLFFACLYATMFYLLVPQFFVSIGIVRYRYPFDMLYCLVLGIVAMHPISLRPRKNLSGAAPGGEGPCAASREG